MKQISLITLFVKDQDAAIEFYKKVGFVLIEDLRFGANRWVTLRLPGDQVVSIALTLAESDSDLTLVGTQGGSQPLLGIVTNDCRHEFNRMKEAGITFNGEPEVQVFGTGVMFDDLYGNKIYLNEEPALSIRET